MRGFPESENVTLATDLRRPLEWITLNGLEGPESEVVDAVKWDRRSRCDALAGTGLMAGIEADLPLNSTLEYPGVLPIIWPHILPPFCPIQSGCPPASGGGFHKGYALPYSIESVPAAALHSSDMSPERPANGP
jgi:hypothetical protein